jgi:hypothetical protein
MPRLKKRITVYLDDTVWQEFRIACLQHKRSASQHLSVLITVQLNQWKEEDTTKQQPTTTQAE